MKIRIDFVTNSSSSSYATLRIKSPLLAKMLIEHGIKSEGFLNVTTSGNYNIRVDKALNIMCDNGIKSVKDLLDMFFWELSDVTGVDCSDAWSEYSSNRGKYIGSVQKAYYTVEDSSYGEFGDKDDTFTYSFDAGNRTMQQKALD